MIKYTYLHGLAIGGLLMLVGCAKDVSSDIASNDEPTSVLNIVTRTGDGDTGQDEADGSLNVSSGQIYIFNGNNCVSTLSFGSTTTYTSQALPAGTYDVYAIGGNDLSHFDLPTEESAKPNSEILLKQDWSLDDLLMQKASSITLVDGETHQLNMTLERKVLRIEQLTINQVPDEVTAVSIELAPFYSQLYLNGEYGTATESASVSLTEGDDNVWQMQSQLLYLYPSSGKPTITVRFTWPSGVKSDGYQADAEWRADHEVKIEGTYKAQQGVTLTGTLTGSKWGDDININFNFDENGSSGSSTGGGTGGSGNSSNTPTVGGTYNEHYVVAVEGSQVTLVSNNYKTNIDTFEDYSNQTNIANVESALSSWAIESGVSGTWRIPTAEEASIFLADANCTSVVYNKFYYCLDGETLKSLYVSGANSLGSFNTVGSDRYLIPVIDITIP